MAAPARRVEQPKGKLTIHIISATQLYNTQMLGKQDPYVKVTIVSGKKSRRPFKTGVANNKATSPTWGKEFVTSLDGTETEILFEVWNANPLSDDLIGSVTVRPVDIPLNVGATQYELSRKKGKVTAGFLTVDMVPEGIPQSHAAPAAPQGGQSATPPIVAAGGAGMAASGHYVQPASSGPPPQQQQQQQQPMVYAAQPAAGGAYGQAPVYRPYGQPVHQGAPLSAAGPPQPVYQPPHGQPQGQQQYYQPPQGQPQGQQQPQYYQPAPQQGQQQPQYYQPAPQQGQQQPQYYQPQQGQQQQQQQYYRPPQ